MHLYTEGDTTYHLHPKAIDEKNRTVVLCDSCFECLDYSTKISKKLPLQTFKAYDVGSIPSYLPKLTLIECLAIGRGLASQVLINLRAMGSGVSQKALRGHSICLPLSKEDGAASDATSLPRTDLHKHVAVAFMGTKPMWKIAREVAKTHAPLSINMNHILQWLRFLKSVQNPWYQDVKIPETEEEIKKAKDTLNDQLDKIINGVSASNSGIVHRMASEVRGTEQFKNAGGDSVQMKEGVTLEPIMLLRLHVVESVETLSMSKYKVMEFCQAQVVTSLIIVKTKVMMKRN